jgi:hypothetical protein
LNHDVRATAQTRATNRSISDLIWLWEISFEEISNIWNIDSSNKVLETANDDTITWKQKHLLIKLVESKYQDEQTRNALYKKIDSLSKAEARETIRLLIEEGVEI